MVLGVEQSQVCCPTIRVELCNRERSQKVLKLFQGSVGVQSQDIGKHSTSAMIDSVPQPALLPLRLELLGNKPKNP
jgi:hypothetical protein